MTQEHIVEELQEMVAQKRPLKEVLTTFINALGDLLGARSSAVILLDKPRIEAVFFSLSGGDTLHLEETRFPATQGITGQALLQKKAVICNCPADDPHFYREIDKKSGLTTESILVVPFFFQEELIGALDLVNKPGGFTDDDLRRAESIARSAGELIGRSKELADEMKSSRFLEDSMRSTIDSLFKWRR